MSTTVVTCKTIPGSVKLTSSAGDNEGTIGDVATSANITYRLLFSAPVTNATEADAIAGARVPGIGDHYSGGPADMLCRNRNWQSNPSNRAVWTCELTYRTPSRETLSGNMVIHGAALPGRTLTAELEDVTPEEAEVNGVWEWRLENSTVGSTTTSFVIPMGTAEGRRITCNYTHPEYDGKIKASVSVGDAEKLSGSVSFGARTWGGNAVANLDEVEPSAAQSGGTYAWSIVRGDGSTANVGTSGSFVIADSLKREGTTNSLKLTYSHNDYQGQLSYTAPIADMVLAGGGGSKYKNPRVGIAYDVVVDTNSYQEVATECLKKQYNGSDWTTSGNDKIVNSVGDPFASPVMTQVFTTTISWWQLEPTNFDPSGPASYQGVINQSAQTVAGFFVAAEEGIIRKATSSMINLDDGTVRWKTTYSVEIKKGGWWTNVNNVGFRHKTAGGVVDILQKDAIDASGMSAADKTKRKAALKGPETIATPWALNQDGTIKTASNGAIVPDTIGFMIGPVGAWPSGMATQANNGN